MPSSSSTRGENKSVLGKNTQRSDAASPPPPESSGCCCFGGGGVVDSVVELAKTQAGSLRAAPPLMLNPGYAGADSAGRAPPTHGKFEVVNKSKHPNEIVGVLVSPVAAMIALKRQRDLSGHMEYLRHGCMPAQTVMNASFGDDVETLEVALFYGCKHHSVDALTTVPNIADAFEHVKGYRVNCKGRNVLLKYKDGIGLEPQKGEKSFGIGLGKKRASSIGGGIDMKTNIQVLELVPDA